MPRITASIFAVAFLISIHSLGSACDCAGPPEPAKALEGSAAVFLGKVVAIDDGANNDERRTVTLDVELWWKGGDATRVKVTTAKSGATCGFYFKAGERYLVYANAVPKAEPWNVSLCSRTRAANIAETSGDFAALGKGQSPKK